MAFFKNLHVFIQENFLQLVCDVSTIVTLEGCIILISASADGLAPLGARPSAGTVMTKYGAHIYSGPILKSIDVFMDFFMVVNKMICKLFVVCDVSAILAQGGGIHCKHQQGCSHDSWHWKYLWSSPLCRPPHLLSHGGRWGPMFLNVWPLHKMATTLQTTVSNAFFFRENHYISIQISLKFIPWCPIDKN